MIASEIFRISDGQDVPSMFPGFCILSVMGSMLVIAFLIGWCGYNDTKTRVVVFVTAFTITWVLLKCAGCAGFFGGL